MICNIVLCDEWVRGCVRGKVRKKCVGARKYKTYQEPFVKSMDNPSAVRPLLCQHSFVALVLVFREKTVSKVFAEGGT